MMYEMNKLFRKYAAEDIPNYEWTREEADEFSKVNPYMLINDKYDKNKPTDDNNPKFIKAKKPDFTNPLYQLKFAKSLLDKKYAEATNAAGTDQRKVQALEERHAKDIANLERSYDVGELSGKAGWLGKKLYETDDAKRKEEIAKDFLHERVMEGPGIGFMDRLQDRGLGYAGWALTPAVAAAMMSKKNKLRNASIAFLLGLAANYGRRKLTYGNIVNW